MINHILRFILLDILKNKLVIIYMVILALTSISVFSLEDNSEKGIMSMLNLVLLILPLFCIIFSNIYMYNSTEFIELLTSQPINRKQIWWGLFLGLSISLIIAFLVGAGLPVLLFKPDLTGLYLIMGGIFLSLIFVVIAMLSFVINDDKAKGIGLSIVIWLFMTFIYDGLMVMLMFQFSDYPIEKGLIVLSSLNPIDLSRIMILLHLDASAMMGFTGALFKDFFGGKMGIFYAFILLSFWVILPFYVSKRKFLKKDL